MGLYEEEKRRVEHNMLALSNVNLATSGFVGPEIQKMLSHALERVLSVVRMPAGALFLHHGNAKGPTSVVAVGLAENFCAASQEEGLDDHLVDLVSRLGGLVVFRDLGRDASWAALEGEEAFRRFRQLAMARDCARSSGSACKPRSRPSAFCSSARPIAGGLRQRSFACFLRLVIKSGWQWKIVTLSSSQRAVPKSYTCSTK